MIDTGTDDRRQPGSGPGGRVPHDRKPDSRRPGGRQPQDELPHGGRPGSRQPGGLRERKKAKTRSLLQEHALRLFREQGYEGTTIEQIADAAEVSTTTVYRYFQTKADLVIRDDLDERMIEAYRAQPPELSAIQALRGSLRTAFGSVVGAELAMQREREQLLRREPELRAAMLDELTRTLLEIRGLIAERARRDPADDAVVALAGAVVGLAIAAWLGADGEEWMGGFAERVDAGMALLETGFRL